MYGAISPEDEEDCWRTQLDLMRPWTDEVWYEIVDTFRSHLRGIPRKEGQKVLAVIDAIVSVPGVVLPWERMVQVCKEENVWSLVDAAHAIGHIPIDLSSAAPDFWVSVRSMFHI